MAYKYLEKAVYIRETTNGKTKWVKIPGVMIQNGHSVIRVYLDHEMYNESNIRSWTGNHTFEKKGRAE
jgi:hypothetical protein